MLSLHVTDRVDVLSRLTVLSCRTEEESRNKHIACNIVSRMPEPPGGITFNGYSVVQI